MKHPNLKNEIISHLSKLGFKFNVTVKVIERQLHKLMGSERYTKYLEITEARNSGLASIRDLYQFTQTAEEANLLLSYQSQALLENTAWFTQKIMEINHQPDSIIDFGCATGGSVSWLAHSFPQAKVVGVDRESNFMDFAKKIVAASNVNFILADYSDNKSAVIPKAQFGISSFGIDFYSSEKKSLHIDTLRDGKLYEDYKNSTLAPLSHWRSAVNDDGYLLTVLRISGISIFTGVIDAAHEAGWSVDLNSSQKIKVENEIFPALVFKAARGRVPSNDELFGFWIGDFSSPRVPLEFEDSIAIAMFKCLAPKTIIASQQHTYPDGHTMQCDIGIVGAFSFLFAHATTGYAHLILDSIHAAERLKNLQADKYGF